jgi:hypothetical protein
MSGDQARFLLLNGRSGPAQELSGPVSARATLHFGWGKVPPLKSSRRTSSARPSIPREALLAIYDDGACHLRRRVNGRGARASAPLQVIGVVAVAAWTAAIMGSFFAAMHCLGLLRVTQRQEEMGLDLSYHGGTAYEQLIAERGNGNGGSSGLGRRASDPRLGGGDVGGGRGNRPSCLPLARSHSVLKAEEPKVDPEPPRDDAVPFTPPA